jgi:hypothetical protein
VATIDHPSGPTDVILRLAPGGGFVAPGVLLTEIPEFTLYGDGTVVYRDPATSYVEPPPSDAEATGTIPAATAAALPPLEPPGERAGFQGVRVMPQVSDSVKPQIAPSTTFTLQDDRPRQDRHRQGAPGSILRTRVPTRQRAGFQALARRLVAPGPRDRHAGDVRPALYRGILYDALDLSPSAPSTKWPWTTFGPDGFAVSSDPVAMQVPTRTLSAADVAALSIDGLEGGADSMALKTSDGKIHVLALRPLLPDERS